MQAIVTKYLRPTDSRGSRIKATCESGTVTVPYPYELSSADCHAVAALALCRKMGWTGDLISGGTDTGYVFVFAASDHHVNPLTREEADATYRKRFPILAD